MAKEFVCYKEAIEIILKELKQLKSQKVELLDANNCILAEDVFSDIDNPPLDNSAMDGYGVKHRDLKGLTRLNPARLEVVGSLQAGQLPQKPVAQKQAIRIMTGAPIPEGVDTVVPVEDTQEKDGYVLIYKEIEKKSNIRRKGEDIRAKEKVLTKGKLIRPAEIGMLAALGYSQVKVIKNPTVGILATGDELIDIGRRLPFGKIRNSNSYSLAAGVSECGGKPILLGIAKDKPEELNLKIKQGLGYDALIISGGISMGRTDYVRQIIENLGIEIRFAKVAQRPGQPFAFGMFEHKPIFCLPGNPVSSLVVFEMYVRPALFKMGGRTNYSPPQVTATIGEEIRVKPGRRYFLRVKIGKRNNQHYACLTGPQGSGILKSMVLADGLLIIPEDIDLVKKGERWPIILFQTRGY